VTWRQGTWKGIGQQETEHGVHASPLRVGRRFGKSRDSPEPSAESQKLREAQFFLAKLAAEASTERLDREDFEFYLSAFLAAGRSVTFALQFEQKPLYDGWYPGWRATLPPDDADLFDFMKAQRNTMLKEGEPKTDIAIEYIPVTELRRPPGTHPAYGFHWFGPPGVPPPSVGVKVHRFEVSGKKEEVLTVCRRYVNLLEALVASFVAAHP